MLQRDTVLSKKASGAVIHEMLLTQLLQYEHKQTEVSRRPLNQHDFPGIAMFLERSDRHQFDD